MSCFWRLLPTAPRGFLVVQLADSEAVQRDDLSGDDDRTTA